MGAVSRLFLRMPKLTMPHPLTVGTIWIVATMIAIRQGLREIPAVVAAFPAFLRSGLWNFLPLLLLLVGFSAELIRRLAGDKLAKAAVTDLPDVAPPPLPIPVRVPPAPLPSPLPPKAPSEREKRVAELLPSSPDGRVYVEKLPQELAAPFMRGLTAHQATKLVSDFLGKIVRWRLSVDDVNRFGQYATVSAFAPSIDMTSILIQIQFSEPEATGVLHLEKGDVVEIEGKVESIVPLVGICINLVECRLFKSRRGS